MTRRLFTLIIALVSMATMSWAQFESAPAFPGAEGHGRFVTGGRGGNVIHVTNLNDSGTGSFRAAVTGSSKKIIVFDVAGVIALESDLSIGSNTTIEGQTAPSPGITLRYYTVQPGENNIIRYIRCRRGQEKDINDGADASWRRNVTGIILDHCSFSWSIDEVASFYDNNNFTMQWCTIAESLVNAGHDKGAHGYGGIWGGKLASFHHNMIAHVANRGPRFNGGRYEWSGYTNNKEYSKYKWANAIQAENVDFRNCVMYNASATCYGGPGGGEINMINNYYKAGPAGGDAGRVTLVTVAAEGNSDGHPNVYGMTSRYYISGNSTQAINNGAVTKNRDWNGVTYDSGTLTIKGEHYSKDPNSLYADTVPDTLVNGVRYIRMKLYSPAPMGYINTHVAATAYEKVLDYAGASYNRDEVDDRYVLEARTATATYKGSVTGKAGRIDVVSDVNGYTEENFPTNEREEGYDTDSDGMPDAWEKRYGLDPNNANDANKYTLDTKGYYTNVEVYCNSLVEDAVKAQLADADTTMEGYYEEYYPAIKPKYDPDIDGPIVNMTKINLDNYSVKTASNHGKITAVSFEPENASLTLDDIAWSSDNDKVAEIINSTSGEYIINGAGTAHIIATALDSAHVTATATVIVPQLGDANGDMKISVADANAVINNVSGKGPEEFYADAANITGNDTVNVKDANYIMDSYLTGNAPEKQRIKWDPLYNKDIIYAVNKYGTEILVEKGLFFSDLTTTVRKYDLTTNTYGTIESVKDSLAETKAATSTYPRIGYMKDNASSGVPVYGGYMGNFICLNLGTNGWAEFTTPEIPAGKYNIVLHAISDRGTQYSYYTNGTSTMFSLDGNEVTVAMFKGLNGTRAGKSYQTDIRSLWEGMEFKTAGSHTFRIKFLDTTASTKSTYHQYIDYVEFIRVE